MLARIIIYIIAAFFLVHLLYLLTVVIAAFSVKNEPYTKQNRFVRRLLNSVTAFIMFWGRIDVKVTGLSLLPQEKFLLVCNHLSAFDPIVTWYALRGLRDVAFISKEENFHAPLFGRLMNAVCCLPIDREDPRRAIETINKASALISSDEVSVGVYPEGTRSAGSGLLPFHNGVLKIAKKSHAPILVMTVRGTREIQNRWPLKRSTVNVDFIKVFDADCVSSCRTADLGAEIRSLMEAQLK